MPPSINDVQKWKMPDQGWLKMNADATIFSKQNKWGMGMLFRNHLGRVYGWKNKLDEGPFEPKLAESLVIRTVVVWGKEMNIQMLQIETDCQRIVQALHQRSFLEDRSYIGLILYDISHCVKSFQHWSISYIHRKANCGAHRLARMSLVRIDVRTCNRLSQRI